MQTVLHPAGITDTPLLANLVQLYLYDASILLELDVDERGIFVYAGVDAASLLARKLALLIYTRQRLVGFALVDKASRIHQPFDGHSITDFFVLRRYRRQGIGRCAATQIFNTLPGRWEIASAAANVPAQTFWRSVIDHYTGGHYDELWYQTGSWRGPIQSFIAPAAQAVPA